MYNLVRNVMTIHFVLYFKKLYQIGCISSYVKIEKPLQDFHHREYIWKSVL